MNREILLIVEDNEILRNGLSEMLRYEGFIVLAASNGREALEHMNEITPDLILSDIAMPEMDGVAFFRAVRDRKEWVSIPFIFLTARSEREDIVAGKVLGAEDYLIKPLAREELITSVRSRLMRSRQLRVAQLRQAYEASLTALANAIDQRDRRTPNHVERVTAYTLLLAHHLGWSPNQAESLRLGAILHDVGKIHIDEETLLKPGPLTEKEWQQLRQHPVNGAEMIKTVSYLAGAVPIVRHHHEFWDGQGYPDGLAGEVIPLGARIVAVADGFDAMTSERPYRPPFSIEDAYAEIARLAGEQYDPRVVDAFRAAWDEGTIQAVTRTNGPSGS